MLYVVKYYLSLEERICRKICILNTYESLIVQYLHLLKFLFIQDLHFFHSISAAKFTLFKT